MKAYIAIVEESGHVASSMLTTNTPVEMLKHIFVSGISGEFNLTSPKIERRVFEVNQFWVDHQLHDLNVNEVLDKLSSMLEDEEGDLEEEVLELLGNGLTDEPQDFLRTLRQLFNGEIEDMSEMSEDQTFLMAMISL